MTRIAIVGWRPGFQKVPFTTLLQADAHLSLKQAKACTDRVLENVAVTFDISSPDEADEFVRKAESLGAQARIENV
jgi:hypothetical protein